MGVLKVKTGGVWVPVGGGAAAGGDEVQVAGAQPSDPAVDLWYDEADPGSPLTPITLGARMWVQCPPGDQPGFGATPADISGSILTWSVDQTRLYKVSGWFVVTCDQACDVNFYLHTAAGDLLMRNIHHIAGPGKYITISPWVPMALSAVVGDYSTVAKLNVTAGVGTVLGGGWLMVEDIGDLTMGLRAGADVPNIGGV